MVIHITDTSRLQTIKAKADGVPYRQALEITGGKLASNRDFHRIMVLTDDYTWVKDAFPAWAREILATPEVGGRFKPGADIKDKALSWFIPVSMLKHAEGGDPFAPSVGLFIMPNTFEPTANGAVLIPKSITVVSNLQDIGKDGKFDLQTGLVVKPAEGEVLGPKEKGSIYYPREESIRPIMRGGGILHQSLNIVYADSRAYYTHGVLLAEPVSQ